MDNIITKRHRQCHSKPNTIICPKRRIACPDPIVFNDRLDRISDKIMVGGFPFLCHHVKMRLDSHRRTVCHIAIKLYACWFIDKNIAFFIFFDR